MLKYSSLISNDGLHIILYNKDAEFRFLNGDSY